MPVNSTIPTTSILGSIRPIDLIYIIRRRWLIGLAVGLVVSTAIAVKMLNEPPRYRTSSKLIVEINPEKMLQLQDLAGSNQDGRIYDTIVNVYLERLRSRKMASVVLESMDDIQLEELRRAYPGASNYITEAGREIPNLASAILQATSASWNPQIQTITISAVHPQPKVVKLIVDAYSNALILMQNSRTDDRTEQTLSFLEEQSEGLQNKLEEGENQLQAYRRENNLGSIEGSIDLVDQRLSQLSGALNEKSVQLITKQNQLDQIETAGEELDQLLNIAFISSRPRIQALSTSLDDIRSERSLLAKTYGVRHPLMVDNQETLNARHELLKKAAFSVVDEVRNDYEVTQSSYDSLKAELEKTEAEALELDRLAIEYRVLKRNLDVQRQIFDVVAEKFTATGISSQFDMARIEVLDGALVPDAPFAPDPKKAFILAGFLFAVCFIGLPLGMELLDNRLKTFADIENFVGKPVYGDIPRIKDKSDKDLSQATLHKDDMLVEAYRTIYSSLKLHTDIKVPYCLLVTSTIPSEGKTFVACNISETFARHGSRTLLIDCDLRRPSVHRQFELKNDVGLMEWVESRTPLPSIEELPNNKLLNINQISDNLSVLTSGGSTREPTEVIGRESFNRLITRLKETYDVIIIDTPPSGLFPDAALAAEYADHTLFVTKQKEVPRQKVRFAVNRLEKTNAPVAGVVLNFISDTSVASGYGYHGQDYSYAYGYERDQAKYQKYYDETR